MWKFIVLHRPFVTFRIKTFISQSFSFFRPEYFSNKNQKIIDMPNKVVPSLANLNCRPLSTLSTNKRIFSKERVLSFLLGSSLLAAAYILQDRKRKRHPVILKKQISKARTYTLPSSVPFLIVGAGTAGHAAARAIRASDADNRVLMVGDEPHLPYMRPPLCKELWFTEDAAKVDSLVFQSSSGRFSDLFWEEDGYYCAPEDLSSLQHGGTAVALGIKAVKIDTQEQMVWFDDGQKVKYNKCLLATGARPKSLDVLHNDNKNVSDRVLQIRTIDDFKRLREVSRHAGSVAVVGADVMASEISCALANKALGDNKLKVFLINPEKGILAHMLPAYLSRWATTKLKQEGVRVVEGREVVEARFDWFADQVLLKLSDNSEIRADYVMECVGLQPNVELASGTNIKLDPDLGGFLADAEMKAGENLWVAGDVASFQDEVYGRRRLQHHNNAFFSGRLAGQNMSGESREYWLQQTLWGDLGASSAFQAVGIVDSSLPTVAVFTEKRREGAVPLKEGDNNLKEGDNKLKEGDNKLKDGDNKLKEGNNKLKEGDNKLGDVENKGQEHMNKIDDKLFGGVEGKKDAIRLNDHNETVAEDLSKGVVFYLKDQVVVGVLLWNVFNADQTAKNVLHQFSSFSDYSELAKLFKLYDPAGPDD